MLPVLVAVALQSAAADGADVSADPRSPATKAMAARLAELADRADPSKLRYLSAERVEWMRERLARRIGGEAEAGMRVRLALELVQSNEIDDALAEIERAAALAERGIAFAPEWIEDRLLRLESMAWQRLGEIQNCLGRHGCESCILPIAPGAVHVEQAGSKRAIEALLELLRRDPEDLDARWRLNVCHQTLGTWPDGVPTEHLIPPSVFASEASFPRFHDVARACGFEKAALAGGVVTEDFDGDGWIDVMVSSWGRRDPLGVYRNQGDGTFRERTREAGLEGICGGLNLAHGDYDNDGDADVVVLRGAWAGEEGCIPDSLLRNRGDGTFDDVTEEAGLLSFHPSQAGRFADFDGDGWLDLVIGNETEDVDRPHPCELFLNRRDGTFQDVAAQVGANYRRFVKAVAAGDYDDDGRPDLFLSCRNSDNVLLRNVPSAEAPGFEFVDTTHEAGVTAPSMSFPCWFFDYDNDGRLDLFVASNSGFTVDRVDDIARLYLDLPTVSELPRLYRNRGDGRFEDVSQAMRVDRVLFSMGGNYGDLDNDGFLDLYLGTGAPDLRALVPNRMLRNDGGRGFQDVTTAGGFGHLQKGHGIAFADFDEDGDQDLYAVLGGAFTGDVYPDALFENPGFGRRWITLRLRGTKANRSAIGARIHVRVATPAGERSIHATVDTGGSFGSSSLQQEIGLGDAVRIVALEIRWPGSGARQSLTDLPLDRIVEIVEGEATARVREPRRIDLMPR